MVTGEGKADWPSGEGLKLAQHPPLSLSCPPHTTWVPGAVHQEGRLPPPGPGWWWASCVLGIRACHRVSEVSTGIGGPSGATNTFCPPPSCPPPAHQTVLPSSLTPLLELPLQAAVFSLESRALLSSWLTVPCSPKEETAPIFSTPRSPRHLHLPYYLPVTVTYPPNRWDEKPGNRAPEPRCNPCF